MVKRFRAAYGLVLLLPLFILSCSLIPMSGPEYLTHIYSRVDSLAVTYPVIAVVDSIGSTGGSESYDIKRITLTSQVQAPDGYTKPRFLLTGATHGNEQLSAEVAMLLAEHLASSYVSNPQVKSLLDDIEIHIIPILNPWGVANKSRFTANGTDINRDFGLPDPDLAESPINTDWFHPWTGANNAYSTPESLILRTLCEEEWFIASIQGHTGAENINLPMDYLAYTTLDGKEDGDPVYEDEYIPIYPLMKSYADAYTAHVSAYGYPNFYTTEGGDWYIVQGSFTDWHFGALGAPGFTIEYDETKGVVSNYTSAWNAHRQALIDILEITRHRVTGRVKDASDTPISVRIDFTRVPDDESRDPGDPTPLTLSTQSDAIFGCYHILLPEGEWNITVQDGTEGGSTKGSVTINSENVPITLSDIVI